MSNEGWLLELGHSRLKILPRQLDAAGRTAEALPVAEFEAWLDRHVSGSFWLAAVPEPDVVGRLTAALDARGLAWHRVVTGFPGLPVAPAYPGLGVDRWLAMQPVWAELQRAFCLVDCGTAMTIDVVDDAGRHRGGWITPGLESAASGLLARAPGLRRKAEADREVDGQERIPAVDTRSAINRGLRLQQAGTIRLAHQSAAGALGSRPLLVLTGGDAAAVQSAADADRVRPDVVLQGLAMAAERLEQDK